MNTIKYPVHSSEFSCQLYQREALNQSNLLNAVDVLPDKPVMYSGSSGSSWGHGHMKLPHQVY